MSVEQSKDLPLLLTLGGECQTSGRQWRARRWRWEPQGISACTFLSQTPPATCCVWPTETSAAFYCLVTQKNCKQTRNKGGWKKISSYPFFACLLIPEEWCWSLRENARNDRDGLSIRFDSIQFDSILGTAYSLNQEKVLTAALVYGPKSHQWIVIHILSCFTNVLQEFLQQRLGVANWLARWYTPSCMCVCAHVKIT